MPTNSGLPPSLSSAEFQRTMNKLFKAPAFITGPLPHENWPELSASLEKLSVAYQRLHEALPSEGIPKPLALNASLRPLPKEDKRVRVSAKTGATWPKAKGSY